MAPRLIAGPVLAPVFTLMFALLLAGSAAQARDFGTHGPLWDIAEPNLLEVIQTQLQTMEETGEIAAMQQEMQDRTRAYVERPRPVQGLLRAQETRRFEVDLTITLSRDLRDHQGRVFARAGTRINPMDYSRFDKRIVILDGDDPAQVAFALEEGNELDTLLVLTRGAPLELMRTHGRRFYFDQDAQMVSAFHIERLPSVVERGTDRMIVTEVALEDTP